MSIVSSMEASTLKVLNVQPGDIVMGGVQMRSIDVGKRLEGYGIQTNIMVARNSEDPEGGPVSRAARKEGLRVFQYEGIHRPRRFHDVESFMHNLKWLFTFPIAVMRASRIIVQSGADIVHVNGLLNLVPAVAARLTGRRLVWSLIGDHYPKAVVSMLRPLLRVLPHRRVVLAEAMKKYYFADGDFDQGIVIREPVDLTRFVSRNEIDESLFEELGISPSQTVVGAVGNIVPSKGWLYFLNAASEIVEGCPDVHFLIIGAESETQRDYAQRVRARIRELNLEDCVTLTGYRTDVEDLLALVDVFMLASLNEGTPLAILEAMATGIPVVATDVGGVSEQIIDGETGMLVPPGDVSALVQACQHLLSNTGLQEEMGRAGRRHVEEHYSLESCARRHRSLYQDVVDICGN